MQGRVIQVREGQGRIMSADGRTFAFLASDISQSGELAHDALVDFVPVDDRATQIVTLAVSDYARPASDTVAYDPERPRNHNLPPRVASESFPGFFWKAVTSRYADFNGRARRSEYWSFILFGWLLVGSLFLVPIIADSNTYVDDAAPSSWALACTMVALGAVLALLIPNVAVAVRRLHDVGMSGWLYLLILIPTIGGIFMLVVGMLPSQPRANKWGLPPQ